MIENYIVDSLSETYHFLHSVSLRSLRNRHYMILVSDHISLSCSAKIILAATQSTWRVYRPEQSWRRSWSHVRIVWRTWKLLIGDRTCWQRHHEGTSNLQIYNQCKEPRHTKHTCWKLHDKPTGYTHVAYILSRNQLFLRPRVWP